MFSIRDISKRVMTFKPSFPKDEEFVIDGAEAFKLLSPIDKNTGLRTNPLRILDSLSDDPAISRALNDVFMEMQPLGADPALSNDDIMTAFIDRASVGTPYENERFAQRALRNMDVILGQFGRQPKEEVSSDKIKFEESDVNDE